MYVHLDDLVISHDDDRITNGREIILEIHLLLDVEGLVEHDQKLCTVTELNLCISLRFDIGSHCACFGRRLGRNV